MSAADGLSLMPSQRILWKRPGTTRWGEGWVQEHGQRKTHEPGAEEHVSFANHDLSQNGLPQIEIAAGEMTVEISEGHRQAMDVLEVIRYHGFEFAD